MITNTGVRVSECETFCPGKFFYTGKRFVVVCHHSSNRITPHSFTSLHSQQNVYTVFWDGVQTTNVKRTQTTTTNTQHPHFHPSSMSKSFLRPFVRYAKYIESVFAAKISLEKYFDTKKAEHAFVYTYERNGVGAT